jgi:hypothetical protein
MKYQDQKRYLRRITRILIRSFNRMKALMSSVSASKKKLKRVSKIQTRDKEYHQIIVLKKLPKKKRPKISNRHRLAITPCPKGLNQLRPTKYI